MKNWQEGTRDDIGFIVKHPEVDKEDGETGTTNNGVNWYIEALRHGVNLGEEMKMTEIKPCPFCGETPNVYGRKRRDYVNSIWADQEEEEYWVKPNCLPMCFLGNIHATAFGFVDGMKYRSPELAIKVWNERKGGEADMDKVLEIIERLNHNGSVSIKLLRKELEALKGGEQG